jgi:hypothetical protein
MGVKIPQAILARERLDVYGARMPQRTSGDWI